ncbi:MAG: phosphoribosylglycinamide formyltransferase [Syntrophomonadaceae bacterium]|nr:phosphoribosylglycinamide formyltransferase [Syntrophomonadaceae bacterium]
MIRIMEPRRLKLAVLASGRGSNFDAIYSAIAQGELEADIKILLSDQKQAPALEKAASRGIEALHINPRDYKNRDEYENYIVSKLREHEVDLVVLAGYMRLVGKVFLNAYKWRIINIHPALLPSFTGLHAQQQAVDYGVRYSGCTVHLVDEGMDTGPIILQAVVPVYQEDDEESLAKRILVEEHKNYWRALQLFAEGRLFIDGRRIHIERT